MNIAPNIPCFLACGPSFGPLLIAIMLTWMGAVVLPIVNAGLALFKVRNVSRFVLHFAISGACFLGAAFPSSVPPEVAPLAILAVPVVEVLQLMVLIFNRPFSKLFGISEPPTDPHA